MRLLVGASAYLRLNLALPGGCPSIRGWRSAGIGIVACCDGCLVVCQKACPFFEETSPEFWCESVSISKRKGKWWALRPISGYDSLNRATTSSWSLRFWLRELGLHQLRGCPCFVSYLDANSAWPSSLVSKMQVRLLFLQFLHLLGDSSVHRRLRRRHWVQALTIRLRWSKGTLGRSRLEGHFCSDSGIFEMSLHELSYKMEVWGSWPDVVDGTEAINIGGGSGKAVGNEVPNLVPTFISMLIGWLPRTICPIRTSGS